MKTNTSAFKYICIFLCLILVFVSYSINRKRNQIKELKNLSLQNIEISNIADGTYTGYANTTFLKVKLELIVQNGTLQNVKILMNEGSVGQNVASITETMVKENKIIVSPIPDEEIASVVFMAAATNALSSQNEK
ncbi:MAG: hypothetical protein E7060_07830 [Treponema bryantii]|nr:hypothetical protein [Treponema bryantii]